MFTAILYRFGDIHTETGAEVEELLERARYLEDEGSVWLAIIVDTKGKVKYKKDTLSANDIEEIIRKL